MEKSEAKHYGTFENTEGSDSDTNTNYHYDPNEYLGKYINLKSRLKHIWRILRHTILFSF